MGYPLRDYNIYGIIITLFEEPLVEYENIKILSIDKLVEITNIFFKIFLRLSFLFNVNTNIYSLKEWDTSESDEGSGTTGDHLHRETQGF